MDVEIAGEKLRLPTLWGIVSQVRESVHKRLSTLSDELQQAGCMAASELTENVVKYASADDSSLTVELSTELLRITSDNRVENSASSVLTIIDKIRVHPNPAQLYAEAIEAGLDEEAPGISQQGFYRIVAVGGFKLDANLKNGRLVITAERALS